MRFLSLMMLALLLTSGALWAQGMGGLLGGTSAAVMVNTDKGLFALRNGVLAKYDVATLKQTGTYPLFGALPDAPKVTTDVKAMQDYQTDVQRRQAPAIMLVKDDMLLIVIGDAFARVNQETMKMEASADLKAPVKPADTTTAQPTQPVMRRVYEPAPTALVAGTTLFLMKNTELLAIAIADGKVTRTDLPKEMQPIQMPNGWNGFRNNGGRPGGGMGGPGGATGGTTGGAAGAAGAGGVGAGAAGADTTAQPRQWGGRHRQPATDTATENVPAQ